MDLKNLINEMEKGKESTQMLRNILLQWPRLNVDDDVACFQALDHHCMVGLTSFVKSLSIIRNCDFEGGKRKIDHVMDVTNYPTNNAKEKRGCYKRRKSGDARSEEVTQLRDDGFGWRKYGQKVILNAKHPRNYYRCTHKFDKNCQATKQVQQISDNPTKFKITYHGNHICNHKFLNQSPIIIDNNDSLEDHSAAVVLNFAQTNTVNPFLFPTSTGTATAATAMTMKHEYNSPRSDQCTSLEQTGITGISSTSTLVSEQSDLVSTAENWRSNVTKCETEDDDSSMWTELEELHNIEFL